jgi:FkbM family methyltransferase
MKKLNVISRDERTFDLLSPLRALISLYNHRLAKSNLENYPQIAVFAFDHIGLCINHDGRYEGRMLGLIRCYLESVIPDIKRTVALDIGANIGNHSIFFSEFFGEVLAFEPNPRTFALLKLNSEYSAFENNISCFNFGLSSERGRLFFKSSRSNIGGSHIVSNPPAGHGKEIFLIEVMPADEILDLLDKKISLIKIDVEGHELSVVKGAKELIKKNRPVILFEQQGLEFFQGTTDVIDCLKELDYRFLTIERRFYFGENIILRLAGLMMRLVFGSQFSLVERNYFNRRFYDLIVAVPK